MPILVSLLVAFATSLVAVEPAKADAISVDGIGFDLISDKATYYNSSGTAFSPTSSSGYPTGTLIHYERSAEVNGLGIDVVVSITSTPSSFTLDIFDCVKSGSSSYVLNDFSLCSGGGDETLTLYKGSGGAIEFKVGFFETGTWIPTSSGGTGIPVVLTDLIIDAYDVDRSETATFFGFQQYQVYQTTIFSSEKGFDPGGTTTNGKVIFTSTSSNTDFNSCEAKFRTVYNNVSEFSFEVDYSGDAGYRLDIGDLGLSCPDTGNTLTAAVANPGNRAPTSTNGGVTIRVAENTDQLLEASNFGNYSDQDNNPLAGVRIKSLPASGTLQKLVNGSWVDVSDEEFIPVRMLNSGELRINNVQASTSFDFAVNDGLVDSIDYQLTVTAVTSSQTITFEPPNSLGLNSSITESSYTVSASSGLNVTLESNTPNVCTVSGTTISTLSLAGTCSITASQDGDATYANARSVTRFIAVSSATPRTIDFPAIANQELAKDGNGDPIPETITPTITVSPVGTPYLVSPTSKEVCEISGNSISAKAPGTCTVIAKVDEETTVSSQYRGFSGYRLSSGTTYAPAQKSRSFVITSTKTSQTITFSDPSAMDLAGTTTQSLSATASSGLTVSFTSNDTSVCTVSGSTVTALTTGTCSITANQSGDSTYSAATPVTKTFSVTNTPASPPSSGSVGFLGPLITDIGDDGFGAAFELMGAERVKVSGARLSTVNKALIGDIEAEILETADGYFWLSVPDGLEPGVYDLYVESLIGNVRVLGGFSVPLEISTESYGEMTAWTKRISDDQVKVYVKFPTVGEKVRIGHQTGGSGSYESVYVRTTSSETMEGLRIVEGVGTYIVRTIDLEEINRIRVTVGDEVLVQVRYDN